MNLKLTQSIVKLSAPCPGIQLSGSSPQKPELLPISWTEKSVTTGGEQLYASM